MVTIVPIMITKTFVFFFELKAGQTLKDVFHITTANSNNICDSGEDRHNKKAIYTLHSETPFERDDDDDDGASMEQERWARIVPPEVLNRHLPIAGENPLALDRRSQWWV